MKKLLLIAVLALSSSICTKAQTINLTKNQVTIPYASDAVVIQFFYSPTGKFSHSNSDYSPPTFLSQVVYDDWKQFVTDFPGQTEDSATVEFDWTKLGNYGEHQNWKTIVNNVDGTTYIGNWLDMTENYDAKKIQVVDITTKVFNPYCAPKEHPYYIGVYLTAK